MQLSPRSMCPAVALGPLAAFALLAPLGAGAHAQSEERSLSFAKTQTRTTNLQYLLHLPPGYNESEDLWPLVLFLHGAGERGDDVEMVKEHGPPKLLANGQEIPAIVVSPQCSLDSFWTQETAALRGLLEELQQTYRVDEDRIYVTGLSMGGFGTWDLAAEAADLFAAAAPICGGGRPLRARALTNLPIWAFHGDRDQVVPLSQTIDMVSAIRRAGGHQVRLTVYPDTGHDSWTATYDDPAFWEWLFAQRRGQRVRPPNDPRGAASAYEGLLRYITAWNSGDNEVLRQAIHTPFISFGRDGAARVNAEPADFAVDFDAMRGRGWVRSDFDWKSLEVIHASSTKVQAAVTYRRYDANGSVYASGRALYELTRVGDQWGMQARMGWPDEELLGEARERAVEQTRAVLLDFFAGFNDADKGRATRTLRYPHTFLLPPAEGSSGRVLVSQDASQAAPNFDGMRAAGWHNSTLDSFDAVHVTENRVVWKVVFSRWRLDGTRYLTIPALWIVTRAPGTDAWGMQIRSLMPPTFEAD